MKTKELIDRIRASFSDDEEVIFLYNDDQGAVRSSNISIHEHVQETLNGHWEMKRIDLSTHKEEWVKVDWEAVRRLNNPLNRRFVEDDGTTKDVRKVIEIL